VKDLEHGAEKAFENPDDFYPTPDTTPPVALLVAAIRGSAEERINEPVSKFEPLKASLCAGTYLQFNKSSPKGLSRKRRHKAIPQNRNFA
jgi:hypothetical protein